MRAGPFGLAGGEGRAPAASSSNLWPKAFWKSRAYRLNLETVVNRPAKSILRCAKAVKLVANLAGVFEDRPPPWHGRHSSSVSTVSEPACQLSLTTASCQNRDNHSLASPTSSFKSSPQFQSAVQVLDQFRPAPYSNHLSLIVVWECIFDSHRVHMVNPDQSPQSSPSTPPLQRPELQRPTDDSMIFLAELPIPSQPHPLPPTSTSIRRSLFGGSGRAGR